MENWDDLRICLALARHRTMAAAARAMGTNTATVSRRIARMSSDLGAQLFVKDQAKWSVTPLAQALAQLGEDVEARLTEILQSRDVVLGQTKLRISADLCIMQTELMRVFNGLSDSFPGVDFEISMFPASLAMGETDLVLSYDAPAEGRIIRSRVLDETISLYNCPAHGVRSDDWIEIVLGPGAHTWTDALEEYFGRPPRFSFHGLNVARQAIETSAFSALFPDRYAANFHSLARVPGFPPVTAPVWLSYHESRRHDIVLRDVANWLILAMRQARE